MGEKTVRGEGGKEGDRKREKQDDTSFNWKRREGSGRGWNRREGRAGKLQ